MFWYYQMLFRNVYWLKMITIDWVDMQFNVTKYKVWEYSSVNVSNTLTSELTLNDSRFQIE